MLIRPIGKVWRCIFFVLFGVQSPANAATMLDHAAVTFELAGAGTSATIDNAILPYQWDRLHGAVDGQAHFVFTFASDTPESPQAIYIPRVGNTFVITLNGVVIDKHGAANSKYEDFAKQPRFFRIPSGILRDRNTLDIAINTQGGRNGGLSAVLLGAEDEVQAVYVSSYRWRVTGSLVIAVVSAVLGSLALLLWFRQRESLYFFYAASELLWALYMSDTLLEHSPLPWPWWGVVYYSAFGMSTVLISKFALQVMGLHKGTLKRLSDWNLVLTPPAVFIQTIGAVFWMRQLWGAVTIVVLFCLAFTVVRRGIRSVELEKRVLAVGVIVIMIAGIRDFFAMSLPYAKLFSAYDSNFGAVPWQRYAWLVFGITLAWIVAERMRKSTHEIADMNRTLSRRLTEREAELSAAFALQTNVDRHQAMMEERQRLTRDMHDGLGSQLLGALHMAQDPAATRDALTHQLRETLDHLKLTVDAMQDTQGDIASLLGALRYRLNPRFAAAAVQLTWSVDPLPEIASWTLQKSRDMQMILFEVFSNLIAHAGATHATLHAAHDADRRHIRIALHDNGCGFDVDAMAAAGGRGLANMRVRAARIGADLHIVSTSEGTKTTLALPLEAKHP